MLNCAAFASSAFRVYKEQHAFLDLAKGHDWDRVKEKLQANPTLVDSAANGTGWLSQCSDVPTTRPAPVSGATRGGCSSEFLVIFWSVWSCYGRFWTFSSSRLDSTGPGHPRKWSRFVRGPPGDRFSAMSGIL